MITFVTWKWRGADGRRMFESPHVNVLRAMIARNYSGAHRLVCLTDEPKGLSPRVDAQPMPETKLEHLLSPHTPKVKRIPRRWQNSRAAYARRIAQTQQPQHFPACYRRLWLFSEEARALGERIFLLDIDCVITGDLTPLVQSPADFVGWADPRFGWAKIAGGAWLLRAGSRTDVWTEFDADKSPAMCKARGLRGSDQAWLSYKLFPPAAAWTQADGLQKINWLRPGHALRPSARIVFTGGHSPPWAPEVKAQYPWILKHWRT